MALLSSFFQAHKINPDIYYAFLDDLREDEFVAGIRKICTEVKELYPNTNLVALIREMSAEAAKEIFASKENARRNGIEYQEPDYEEIEKIKADWYALKEKLAKDKAMEEEKEKKNA